MKNKTKTLKEFYKTLKNVEKAYSDIQNGYLGKTILISEGASSYAVTIGLVKEE